MTVITSISMPEELRAALDEEAERQRRSRSFVVAEAVREYLVRRERTAFDEAGLQTLRDGLALTTGNRLELAEELWLELTRGRPTSRPWTATFETFGDYERWRREGGAADA
ncbi:MAG: ribbon-helix-helix domain-containing protein [Gemmatimonadota bacterium]|nr:ribbon-helix-helix domain-containing protein [Gemmatimonadota bacterium]